MAEITKQNIDRINTFPWFRVSYWPQGRTSYCGSIHSRSFETEEEAVSFASGLRGMFRDVEKITGKTTMTWKFTVVAKWRKKSVNGKAVIGRIY